MGLTRISDVGRWTACEAWAMTGQDAKGRQHPVSAWVGSMAHKMLLEGKKGWPTPPARYGVAFDSITPLPSAASSQAQDIATEAKALLDRYGLTIFDSEIPVQEGAQRGQVDLLVTDRKNRAGVLDFKTGRTIGSAWLQLAGYLHAWKGVPLSFAGIIHVPRVKLEPTGTITFRDPEDLVSVWQRTIARVEDVLTTSRPTLSPGTHCARCPLTGCAVRMEKS